MSVSNTGTSRTLASDGAVAPVKGSWAAIAILFVVYLFNSIDRNIISVIAQPIKEELQLADWQLGLLTGLAFSILYVVAGFPMARWADKARRVNILSICILVWSAMTALCGVSANFVQLCLFRMGVGVGEAGCLPASHSLIGDYFPSSSRAKALAIFGLGLPLGGLVGMIVGGIAMDAWGWRAAFFIVGIPGVVMALVTWLFLKEPERGRFDNDQPSVKKLAKAGELRGVALSLWKSPIARNIIIALVLTSFFNSANSVFLGPYLTRKFDLSYTEIGAIISVSFMLGSAVSTLLGGLVADWAGKHDRRWYMWMPALGLALSAPVYVAAYSQSDWAALAALLFFASVLGSTFYPPSYAVLHNSADSGSRATVTVVTQFSITLIGQSLGPLASGLAIDLLASELFDYSTIKGFLAACPGGVAPAGAAGELDLACRTALVDATQAVMIGFLALKIWPAFHFHLAAKHLGKGKLK